MYWDGLGRAASTCIQAFGCFYCDELSQKGAVSLEEMCLCFILTADIYHSVNMSKRISTKFMSEIILTIPILVLNRTKILRYRGVWFICVIEVLCILVFTTLEDSSSYRFFFSWLLMISVMSLIFLTFENSQPSVHSLIFLDLGGQ